MAEKGLVSPASVIAAYAEWDLNDVQKMLDRMVRQGHVEQRAIALRPPWSMLTDSTLLWS